MSDADKHGPGEQAAAGGSPPFERKERPTYAVVPTPEKATGDDPFGFRPTFDPAQPEQAAEPQQPKAIPVGTLALGAVVIVCAVALVFAIPMLMKPKPPVFFIDLGNQRFDPAGLGGRLIAHWQNSATYELTIDPLEPQQLDGFRAVVADPPYPLSVVIRLKDAAGIATCQKEILLPAPQPEDNIPHAKVLLPGKTSSGDTVQYEPGPDGEIAEIALGGPLSCSAEAYRRFTGWDFTSNFPTVANQGEWLKHQNSLEEAKKNHPAPGAEWGAVVQRLPAPIEGDDVITGDNPRRGTVDTGAGRVFLIINKSRWARMSEWQFFPAAIHFRCQKTGVCVLSRIKSRTTFQARLLK